MKKKPIVSHYGNVGVDSGQLLIIDPSYLEMFMKKTINWLIDESYVNLKKI